MVEFTYSIEAGVPRRTAVLAAVLLHAAGIWWLLHAVTAAPVRAISFSMTLAPLSASAQAVVMHEAAAVPRATEEQVVAVEKNALHKVKAEAAKPQQDMMVAAPSVAREAVVAVMKPALYDAAYLHNPKPNYPYLSRRTGEEGTVWLRVRVDAQGGAQGVVLKQSSGFVRLDEAALAAVTLWRFVPAEAGGVTLASQVDVPVAFKLEEK